MAVVCSHCGEALLGAVNRCWRCGTPLAAHSGPPDIPPVRRAPVLGPLDGPLDGPLEAKVFGAGDGAVAEEEAAPRREQSLPFRRGSPFQPGTPTICLSAPIGPAAPSPAAPLRVRERSYSFQLTSRIAAATALVLAILALLLSFSVPLGSFCLAAVAVGFGSWGLFSQHRGVAIASLIVASVVLAWAGFGTAAQVYQWLYGVNPFTAAPLPEDLSF